MADFKLTYFNMRGRAEPIRMLFAVADVPYEDNRLSMEEFGKLKPSLPYGQVPVLEFGGTILSQTHAICRFLARKFNLYGKTDLEAARIDELSDAISEYATSYWAWYGSTEEGAKEKCTKKFIEEATPKFFGKFNQTLETNGKFLVGKEMSWVDISLFSVIEFYEGQTKTELTKGYPALQQFYKHIGSLPKLRAWMEKRPVTDM